METRDGGTILTGEIVDQPHLFGILERINGLGLQPDDAYPNAEGERELQAASETQRQMP